MNSKKHRLPDAAYYGRKAVFFTACVNDRMCLFVSDDIVDPYVEMLRKAVCECGCVAVYCFMPDHLHTMILGGHDKARPKDAMELFKQASGFWLGERNLPGWQAGLYDHIARRDEDLRRQVLYILQNPVRKGLVDHANDFPFSGTIGLDLHEFLWEIDT